MEAFTYATRKTAEFYDSQKRLATEHAVFNDSGAGEPVREAGNGAGRCCCPASLCCAPARTTQAANDPAKRALLEQKDELEQKIDMLKYQKAAMDPEDYKKQLTEALVQLATGAGGAGQMKRLRRIVLLLLACAAFARAALAAPADCWALRKHGHDAKAQRLLRSADAQRRCLRAR